MGLMSAFAYTYTFDEYGWRLAPSGPDILICLKTLTVGLWVGLLELTDDLGQCKANMMTLSRKGFQMLQRIPTLLVTPKQPHKILDHWWQFVWARATLTQGY